MTAALIILVAGNFRQMAAFAVASSISSSTSSTSWESFSDFPDWQESVMCPEDTGS